MPKSIIRTVPISPVEVGKAIVSILVAQRGELGKKEEELIRRVFRLGEEFALWLIAGSMGGKRAIPENPIFVEALRTVVEKDTN